MPEQVREVSAVFRVAGAIDFDLQLIWHFAVVDWREPHAPNANRVGTRRLWDGFSTPWLIKATQSGSRAIVGCASPVAAALRKSKIVALLLSIPILRTPLAKRFARRAGPRPS